MNIDMILSIMSFSLSIGGAIPALLIKDWRKKVVLPTIFLTLSVTTGIVLLNYCQHERLIEKIQNNIVKTLSAETMMFDQIFEELHYECSPPVNEDLLKEALYRAVDGGVINHKRVEFQKNGSIISVKGYFIETVSIR